MTVKHVKYHVVFIYSRQLSHVCLFFLALSSGILERLVQMSDNISKDVLHCVSIMKKQPSNEMIRIYGTLITKKQATET